MQVMNVNTLSYEGMTMMLPPVGVNQGRNDVVPQQQQHMPRLHQSTNGSAQHDPVRKKTTGPIHNPRYKSILCDHWERNGGTCPYAEKCQFAHGPDELAKWQAHRARQHQLQQQQQSQHVMHQQAAPMQIAVAMSMQIPLQQPRYVNPQTNAFQQQVPPPHMHHMSHMQQQQGIQVPPLQMHMSPGFPHPQQAYAAFPQPGSQQTSPTLTYTGESTPASQNYNVFEPLDPSGHLPPMVRKNAASSCSSHTSGNGTSISSRQHVPLYERSHSPDDNVTEAGAEQSNLQLTSARRTASLPQLFSRDFLSSLVASDSNTQNLPSDLNLAQPPSSALSSEHNGSRRGSAPPVVLTNSLADLDSLADELVPDTKGLFSMPTVFQRSINEYL